jgi:hypothetical protein
MPSLDDRSAGALSGSESAYYKVHRINVSILATYSTLNCRARDRRLSRGPWIFRA